MPAARLLRVFGVAFGVAVTVGNTIGAGILRTPGQIAEYLPTAPLFMGIWVLGGIYALLGAISLSELGAALPKSGGQTVFVRRAFGDSMGFLVGWSDWISTCASTAFVSLVVGEYAGLIAPGLAGYAMPIALACGIGFALVHLRGVRLAGNTQLITSAIKAFAFIALIAACFVIGGGARGPAEVPVQMPFGAAIILSLQAVIYTYDGWTGPVYFSEEVKSPGRDIPRAMIAGVLAVTAVYLLTNAAFLYVLPMHEMAGQPLVAATAAGKMFGARGNALIRVLTIVSMLSAINALTLMAPRVVYALGEHGFPRLRSVDDRGTPIPALVLSTIVTVLIIASGTVNAVLALAAFFFVVNYAISFAAVFALRRREPQLERPFRAWGYPWSTGIVLLGSVAFLVGAVAADTRNALYSLALLALSFPVYFLLRRTVRRTPGV